MLEIRSLEKTYQSADIHGTLVALTHIDLAVERGSFVSIVGPSGCGKSTLLEIVAGLVGATSGSVTLNGEPVRGPNRQVGIVFQQDSTFPWLTVQQNAEFGLAVHGVPAAERRERAGHMLRLVGLQDFRHFYPEQLSGGMRQRVAIARVLAEEPTLILMDEPFGALDEQTRLVLGEELLRIWEATGATVLFVTHSLSEAAMLSDRIVVMTSRPGSIRAIVDVPLKRPRGSEVIGTPEFSTVAAELWEYLHAEARMAMDRSAVEAKPNELPS